MCDCEREPELGNCKRSEEMDLGGVVQQAEEEGMLVKGRGRSHTKHSSGSSWSRRGSGDGGRRE